MIKIINEQKYLNFSENFLQENAKKMLTFLKLEKSDISIFLCEKEYIQELNNKYRQKNEPTDILSFPMQELKAGKTSKKIKDLGDLIICVERVVFDANELGEKIELRMKKLLAHGICHLLGYSHYTEEDDNLMKPLEKSLENL